MQPYTPLCSALKHLEMNSSFFIKIIDDAYDELNTEKNGKLEKSKLIISLVDMAKTLNLTKTSDHEIILQIDELFPQRLITKESFRNSVMSLLFKLIKLEMPAQQS
jgi:hypothetical protein